jgi:hypothetical protein
MQKTREADESSGKDQKNVVVILSISVLLKQLLLLFEHTLLSSKL